VRIGIAPTWRHEDLAAAQRRVQLLQYAEGVGTQINGALLTQHMRLPGFRDDGARGRAVGRVPLQVGPQPLKSRDDRFTGDIRTKVQLLDQRRQEATDERVLGIERLVVHVVGRSDQGGDRRERVRDGFAQGRREHPGAQVGIRHPGIQDQLAGAGQGCRRQIKVLQAA
jgi:hypothetical protein